MPDFMWMGNYLKTSAIPHWNPFFNFFSASSVHQQTPVNYSRTLSVHVRSQRSILHVMHYIVSQISLRNSSIYLWG